VTCGREREKKIRKRRGRGKKKKKKSKPSFVLFNILVREVYERQGERKETKGEEGKKGEERDR